MVPILRVLALTLLLAGSAAAQGVLTVRHLNVGQGSATLIVGPTGIVCLVDAGDFGHGLAEVLPALVALGPGADLDHLILTHYHADHWGGIPEVVAGGFPPTTAWDRGTSNITSNIGSYVAAVGGARQAIAPGSVIALGGGATLTCVAANGQLIGGGGIPVGSSSQEENSRSVALRLSYGGFDAALCGDLTGGGNSTTDVEGPLAPLMGDVDLLIVNHHGSATSTNAAWVAGLRPEVSVVSCGDGNPYGHAHASAMNSILAGPTHQALYRLNAGTGSTAGQVVGADLVLTTNGSTYTLQGGSVASITFPVDQAAPAPPAGLLPGDLVIAEYMNNPAAVPDSAGEWVELFNTTPQAIDLGGCVLRDHDVDAITLPSIVLAAHGRMVLGNEANPALNGGFTPTWVWPSGAFLLANGSDEIEITDPLGRVLDTVVYDDGATFPDPNGSSVERRNLSVVAVAWNFGVSTVLMPSGDKGTPGAPNVLDATPPWAALTGPPGVVPGGLAQLGLFAGPALAGRSYLLAASHANGPGTLLPSGRWLHLAPGEVLDFSLSPSNGVFQGFFGGLNVGGAAFPSVAVPPLPFLSGITLHLGGIVLQPGAPDGIATMVDELALPIL